MHTTSEALRSEINKPQLVTPRILEAGFDRQEVYALAKQDLNFLAALAIPEIFSSQFPALHIAIWQLLVQKANLEHDFSKLAVGLPRGHAKTTLIKLFVLYLILFTSRQFILIICANSSLAENFVSDVCDMLDSSNIKTTFGDWRLVIEKDTQDVKKFSFLGRDIILQASGKGAVRGLNIKHRRPDAIVMDDMQTREDSDSPTQADKDLSWMLGTLMKLKDPKRCLYIYIGNMYHSPGCILRKLKKNPDWISFIVGAILADGQSIWPELHSYENLMAEFRNDVNMGKPEIFFSEVMNDPEAGVSSLFNVNLVPQNPYQLEKDHCLGRFVIIDVALDKFSSDDTTIMLYGLYGIDTVAEQLKIGSFNPKQTIIHALIMAMENSASLVAVESVAYQASLLFWFQEVCQEFNITGIEFVEVFPKGLSKQHRILQWFKRILPQKQDKGNETPPQEYLATEVRSPVLFQASQFKPGRRDNTDDIIDNCAYAAQVVENYREFIEIPALAQHVEWHAAKVIENNTPF